MTPVRLEPAAPRSRVMHSTIEPLRSYSVCHSDSVPERFFQKRQF